MKRKCTLLALLMLLAPSSNALEFSSLDYDPTVPYIMFTGTGGTLGESVELVDANGGVPLAANAVIRIQIAGEITNGWFFFDNAAIAADPPAQVTVRTATEESAVYTLPPLPPPCIDKNWTAGAPITTECMPESDRSVFLEEEFFDSQGTSVRRLVEPEEWCRVDAFKQRLYWPREAGANCAVLPQAQIDMLTAANDSRLYWEGLGCQDWYKPHTVTFEAEFTPLLMDFTGGAFSPLMGDGHIFLDSASVQASADFRVGVVLHEMAHAAVQFSIFPSAIADAWGQSRLWPEAIATAAMMANMPGSSYWVDIHGPFPDMWRDGLKFGRNKARHAALLMRWLDEEVGVNFNVCEFMLDQHTNLLNGLELEAFKAHIPSFTNRFALFVAEYNARIGLSEFQDLPSPPPFPVAPPTANSIWGVANGLLDGQTIRVPYQDIISFSLGLEASQRCPDHDAAIIVLQSLTVRQQPFITGQYTQTGSQIWHSDLLITAASPQGDVHMRELVVTSWKYPNIPSGAWPTQDTNDPYPSGCP